MTVVPSAPAAPGALASSSTDQIVTNPTALDLTFPWGECLPVAIQRYLAKLGRDTTFARIRETLADE